MSFSLRTRASALVCLLTIVIAARCSAQDRTPLPPAPAPSHEQQILNDLEAARLKHQAIINGRPYVRPTHHEQFIAYLNDSYGLPALGTSTLRALYGQATGKPDVWGQDWPGYGQRFGTALASTAIDGNVRYGMETVFHEDMRYIPCHGCSAKRKIGNAFLSEFTARHDSDGHRFFTVTPIISDFSGPLITNSTWIPGHGPLDGLIATRTIVASRVAGHLFREFILERRHKDPKLDQ